MGSVAGVASYVGLILAPTWQWVLLGEGLAPTTRVTGGAQLWGVHRRTVQRGEPGARLRHHRDDLHGGAVIGPPLGGWLADTYGFQLMLLCAGALYTLATVIRVIMARTAARGKEVDPQKLSLSA